MDVHEDNTGSEHNAFRQEREREMVAVIHLARESNSIQLHSISIVYFSTVYLPYVILHCEMLQD